MSSVIVRSVDFLCTSDKRLGATQVSQDGSTFTFKIQNTDGFNISKHVKNVELAVIGAEIWFNTPNITEQNNKFYFSYNGQDYDVTFPTGLYSVEHLGTTLKRLVSSVLNIPDEKIFLIEPDEPSQSVVITINNSGDSVYFDRPNTFRELIGYSARTLTSTRNNHSFIGDLRATFSDLSYYMIQSNLCTEGIMVNGQFDSIIAKIQITSEANGQIQYQPSQPAIVDCTERLRKNKDREFTFSLLDNNLNRVHTQGEIYSLHLRLNVTELVQQN